MSLTKVSYAMINGSPVNVLDYGAIGDGSTNSTTAIQAAITYAESLYETDYWGTYVPAVYLPFGVYAVNGLTITKPIHFYGDGQNNTVINLITGSNQNVITINDTSGLAGADNGNIQPIISDLSIGCNSSGQTNIYCRGISIVDSSVGISTTYVGGAEIRNVTIHAAKQYSIYIGVNRNNGRLENVKSLYSGDAAVYSNGYDWRITDSDFGSSVAGNGFDQYTGGATEFVNCNFFTNNLSGVSILGGVNACCLFTNCFFDTNGLHGSYVIGTYGDIVTHSFTNCVWRDNSQTTTNTSSHIFVQNVPQITVDAASFVVNITATKPKYLIETTNVDRVLFNAVFEQNDTANVPYATAISNNFYNLSIGGCENVYLGLLSATAVGAYGTTGANFDIYDAASTTQNRRWRFNASSNILNLYASDDSGAFTNSTIFNVTRSGTTPTSINTIKVAPTTDAVYSLGDGSHRWSVVYAATGTINTSDENEKTEIRELNDKEKAVALKLKASIKAFKFKDAVKEKGQDARIHVGTIAQDVQKAFVEEGLKAEDYGVFCSDTWTDEDGKQHTRLGVRYEELFAFIISAI